MEHDLCQDISSSLRHDSSLSGNAVTASSVMGRRGRESADSPGLGYLKGDTGKDLIEQWCTFIFTKNTTRF